MMRLMLSFFAFIHLQCASHLGMLDEPREEWKDMMLESNQKTVLVDKSRRWCVGGRIQKMEGPRVFMPELEMLPMRVSSNKH